MNAKASRLLSAAAYLREDALIVEVGMVRRDEEVPSDGFSTVYLAEQAAERGLRFVSIDNDPDTVAICAQVLDHLSLHATLICGDGEEEIAKIAGPIDLLYLDGAVDPADAVHQYKAARLADRATVVIDDVQPIDKSKQGKATDLLPLLARHGWAVEVFETEPGYLMAVATR